jgi:hypothetical protein
MRFKNVERVYNPQDKLSYIKDILNVNGFYSEDRIFYKNKKYPKMEILITSSFDTLIRVIWNWGDYDITLLYEGGVSSMTSIIKFLYFMKEFNYKKQLKKDDLFLKEFKDAGFSNFYIKKLTEDNYKEFGLGVYYDEYGIKSGDSVVGRWLFVTREELVKMKDYLYSIIDIDSDKLINLREDFRLRRSVNAGETNIVFSPDGDVVYFNFIFTGFPGYSEEYPLDIFKVRCLLNIIKDVLKE